MTTRPLVYGHRGASAQAPENTIEAYELAGAMGADGVEIDVRLSADGHLVLNHDPVLADGRLIVETPRAELPASVPDLATALDACAGMVVNIEIKNIPGEADFDPAGGIVEPVLALLADRRDGGGVRDELLVSSFHLPTVDLVRDLAPDLRTGFLTLLEPAPLDGLAMAADGGHDAYHPLHFFVDEPLLEAAEGAGIEVNTWTVDDPERMRQLAGWGVDGIVTNVPDLALATLRR